MTIFDGSRYERTLVKSVPDHTGAYRQSMFPVPNVLTTLRYTQYIIQVNDRLDKLAGKFFNDPMLWWLIADANPNVVFPEDIDRIVGQTIRIPVV